MTEHAREECARGDAAAMMPLRMAAAVALVLAFGLACVGVCAGAEEVEAPTFIPTPKSVTMEKGAMPLTAGSRIVVADRSLEPLAAILSDEIWMITDLRLAVVAGEAKAGPSTELRARDIVLKINPEIRADADICAVQKKDGKQQVVRTRDFAHTIAIGDMAVVEGWDYRAVCEGTATILQAITGEKGNWSLPKMTIKDWPHADYTGTMIDAGRQWMPPDVIKFTIEACRFWKIRYVQIHFSDDRAYTFGSKAFPELGNKNHQTSGGIIPRCYTWEEMEDLEAYAVARGVTIVPELETPGHYGAVARSRPDIFKGPGCMPMASEKLYEALDKLVGEMCSIFKASPYFHIGGDECNFDGVCNTPEAKEYMSKHTLPQDDHPLLDAWQVYIMHIIRMKQLCAKYGKIAIAWEGIPGDKRLKDDLIVMTWRNPKYAAGKEQAGWNVITVPWGAGPITKWNMYLANGHLYKRTTNVLGAQRPMWQMSEYSMLGWYVPVLCERQERTWGPDNEIADEGTYRERMARSTERMFNVAAPVKVVAEVAEGGRILGVLNGLQGWIGYSGALTVKLEAPFPSEGKIHYMLDGTDPTPQSPVYTKPLAMERNFVLKAALFDGGRMLGSCNRVKYVWQDIAGWITEYQMAAPYTKDNLPGTKLFDIPFEPETNGKVEWKLWKGSGTRPWMCDLSPRGDNRCGYLRTQIWSPKAQDAMLLVAGAGSVKVWLNDNVVDQVNKVQSYNDPPHKVNVALKEGWNSLMLKVTKNSGGDWGALVRVVSAGGKNLDGLKFKAE